MQKIVIAIDSFKGCASSAEIARAAADGIREVFPGCRIVRIPVADGGEGTVEALLSATGGTRIFVDTHDPLMRQIRASYGLSDDGRTAFVETAAASGLPLLAPQERNPMKTTSFGTGELIRDAIRRGCRNFLIGLGGSATNDGGTGLLQALGYRFYTDGGRPAGIGGESLERIVAVDASALLPELKGCNFTALCDVTNPFYGPEGAARVYAPQKGATPDMIERLDRGMKHWAARIGEATGFPVDDCPGAGAAGGLGGCLLAFMKARLQPGVETVLEYARFDDRAKGADWVLTGEGRLDKQTLRGKVPYGVARAAARLGIPTVALGGAVCDTDLLNQAGIRAVFPVVPAPVPIEKAMEKEFTLDNIRRTTAQLSRLFLKPGRTAAETGMYK